MKTKGLMELNHRRLLIKRPISAWNFTAERSQKLTPTDMLKAVKRIALPVVDSATYLARLKSPLTWFLLSTGSKGKCRNQCQGHPDGRHRKGVEVEVDMEQQN